MSNYKRTAGELVLKGWATGKYINKIALNKLTKYADQYVHFLVEKK